ncbi:MAG: cytochrome P450 [Planktomarina sp.]|uniref:cytochrome P450 n=1 Tax=Planktomarina sp. TaxID=2024851 RepID=UPI003C610E82
MSARAQPPKPPARPGRVSLWRYVKLFRRDLLSAQPAKLYRAWMAEFKTPFFRSYLVNQPELVDLVLKRRPRDFPKSNRVSEGLRPLLGNSVFLTNGAEWERQRRIIDPAFEGGRLREAFPAISAAAEAAVARLGAEAQGGPVEIEAQTSFAAADVIFRTLFSIPIEDRMARQVFEEFKTYQRSQPVVNLAAFFRLPKWCPRPFSHRTRRSADVIRGLIRDLADTRAKALANGTAPNDLATKIMTTKDPITGQRFSTPEMVDQVAIFFFAWHETSASALSWALYLMATHPDYQEKVAREGAALGPQAGFEELRRLRVTRDVFRETLRLYPPVPMMVREAAQAEVFRGRDVAPGSQVVLSPWHLHRHTRLWDNPDGFDPERWHSENAKHCQRAAFILFSAGPRVCTGAGFAMLEGVLLLARLCAAYEFKPVEEQVPQPVAHLTVRSKKGIWLKLRDRGV